MTPPFIPEAEDFGVFWRELYKLTLAVNGNVLGAVLDDSLTSGDVGVVAGTWDDPGLVIAVDGFEISGP